MKEKILLALSDRNLSAVLSEKISSQGYIPIVVVGGDEAMKKMQEEMPDLVLIDLVLPGKSGYEVLNDKSLDRMITKIPVIVVSNSGAPIEMKRLPSTPNIKDYVITTYIEPDEVMKKIDDIFGHVHTEPAEPGAKIEPKGKKILWVEDDKLLGSILSKKFTTSGYETLLAVNIDEAFAILEKQTPDILIVDILLPDTNGFEILRRIKKNEKFIHLPTIILSNLNKPSDVEKAKMLGANKFLVKAAVSLNDIVLEVDNILKKA